MFNQLQLKKRWEVWNLCNTHNHLSLSRPHTAVRLTVFTLVLLLVQVPILSQPLSAQPLDEVIEGLLDDAVPGDPCTLLELAGASLVVGGRLLEFCDTSAGDQGAPSSTGGGASIPGKPPGVVQERLESARGDQEKESESSIVSELMPGWGLFFSAEGERLDRDVTDFEDGFDSDVWRVTIGTDYQLTEAGTIGMALTYSRHEGDFASGGSFDNDAFGLIGFGAFSPSEHTFIQATMGYARRTYDRTRVVEGKLEETGPNEILSGTVSGEFTGIEFSTGILAGYDYTVGRFTIGPRIGLDWIYTAFDSYTEQGGTGLELVFDDTDETSFQSRLGFVSSLALSTRFGVLVPQLSADWVHEFADAQRTLAFSFAEDLARIKFSYEDEKPDRDFFELGAGVSAALPNGWLPYIQFRTLFGHDYLDSYVASFGLRKEF